MSKYILTFFLMMGGFSLQAQDFFQFKNRWKSAEFIHVEQPQPASGTIQPGWLSAQWTLELVDQYYYKIKNRWRNEYLHVEHGGLECGPIQPGWWSAQWILEPVEGTSFYRIRNRWKQEVAIHNQNGSLEAGSILLGWWSAQWEMIQPEVANEPVHQPNPVVTESPVRLGNNPDAFIAEQNGQVKQAYVRYTDQISITGVSVGDYVYFFPQEAYGEAKGASFDLKNPPICGQTYKVIETTPTLKLDRPMPMMRNTNNTYFAFIVEVY